jgi:ribonuclease BN (tRNA processing enzyme)
MQQASMGHLSTDDVGKLAAAAHVKAVVLMHLTSLPEGDDYSSWAEQVKKHYGGQVTIAKDLMSFTP